MTRVLLVGQVPETVDFSDPALQPGLDAQKIHAGRTSDMTLREVAAADEYLRHAVNRSTIGVDGHEQIAGSL